MDSCCEKVETCCMVDGCKTVNYYNCTIDTINHYCCCCCCRKCNGGEGPKPPTPDPDMIIGVVDTGERTKDGAVLLHCDYEGNILTGLDSAYFDQLQPWAGMQDVTIGTNEFVKIPRFWTARDTQPAGKPYAGNQRWMISPVAYQGFESDGAVFKDAAGNWVDQFYMGKYRVSEVGGSAASMPAMPRLGGLALADMRSVCEANGSGYYQVSFQQWNAVLWLAVIEKATFQLFRENIRTDINLCQYRGIQELCYDGTNAGTLRGEWLDGIKTDSSNQIEVFKEDGSRQYINTGHQMLPAAGNFAHFLFDEFPLNKYFLGKQCGDIADCLIPDMALSNPSCACLTSAFALQEQNGIFHFHILGSENLIDQTLGGRLSKI